MLTLRLAPEEPWPEPVDGRLLLREMRHTHGRFVVLPRWADVIVPLWEMHTYAFELRKVCTYLGIESPERRCGKTTLMTLMSELVNRPEVAANISSPAFYRAIEELRPTLLIDEADTLLPGNAQLRGILNSGYTEEMAYVLRLTNEPVQGDAKAQGGRKLKSGSRLARFSCWGPKAIAQIGHLPHTLADRCIIIRMQRKIEQEQCERFQDRDPAVLSRLRRQCARFVLDHAAAITAARPELPKRLHDRAVQICEPLVILADLAGGEWPELAREAAVGLTASAEENSPIGALLFGIWWLYVRTEGGRIFSHTLVEGLNRMSDRPWGGMRHGKGITEAWLADNLQRYEIRPRTIRIGKEQRKGYLEEDFQEAFQRYISRAEIEALQADLAAAAMGGRRTAVSDQRTEDGEQRAQVRTEVGKPKPGDCPPDAGGTPGDQSAAA